MAMSRFNCRRSCPRMGNAGSRGHPTPATIDRVRLIRAVLTMIFGYLGKRLPPHPVLKTLWIRPGEPHPESKYPTTRPRNAGIIVPGALESTGFAVITGSHGLGDDEFGSTGPHEQPAIAFDKAGKYVFAGMEAQFQLATPGKKSPDNVLGRHVERGQPQPEYYRMRPVQSGTRLG